MIHSSWIDVWVAKYSTRSHQLYKGSVFASMPSYSRGKFSEYVARQYYHENIAQTTNPHEDDFHKNGRSSYDFLDEKNQKRIEVKSGQLVWVTDKIRSYWKFSFAGVKPFEFDCLLLLGYFPDRIQLWQWDGITGFANNGNATKITGGRINMYCYREKICWKSFPVAPGPLLYSYTYVHLHHLYRSTMTASCKEVMYAESPLHRINAISRGFLLEELAKSVWVNVIGSISKPVKKSCNGQFEYDFHDNSHNWKVEVKSASMSINTVETAFRFKNVKLEKFDRLLLVFYFPDRLEMYIWDGYTGVIRTGKKTSISGHDIWISAKHAMNSLVLCKSPGKQIFRKYFKV